LVGADQLLDQQIEIGGEHAHPGDENRRSGVVTFEREAVTFTPVLRHPASVHERVGQALTTAFTRPRTAMWKVVYEGPNGG
jgi:hypothetical protein